MINRCRSIFFLRKRVDRSDRWKNAYRIDCNDELANRSVNFHQVRLSAVRIYQNGSSNLLSIIENTVIRSIQLNFSREWYFFLSFYACLEEFFINRIYTHTAHAYHTDFIVDSAAVCFSIGQSNLLKEFKYFLFSTFTFIGKINVYDTDMDYCFFPVIFCLIRSYFCHSI